MPKFSDKVMTFHIQLNTVHGPPPHNFKYTLRKYKINLNIPLYVT